MNSEEEIMSVTVGVPDVLNNTIHLADYDPAWSSIFVELEKEIRGVLKDKVLLLEHIGSTRSERTFG